MNRAQIEVIAATLTATKAAVAHLALVVAKVCELDRDELASGFDAVAEKFPADTPQLERAQAVLNSIAQSIRGVDAADDWDALMDRLRP